MRLRILLALTSTSFMICWSCTFLGKIFGNIFFKQEPFQHAINTLRNLTTLEKLGTGIILLIMLYLLIEFVFWHEYYPDK